jgi:hypothetical protein
MRGEGAKRHDGGFRCDQHHDHEQDAHASGPSALLEGCPQLNADGVLYGEHGDLQIASRSPIRLTATKSATHPVMNERALECAQTPPYYKIFSDFNKLIAVLAEGVGFEPTVPLQARRFSRPVP